MGARFDRLRCEVFQNLFLSPMNTGFVRPAVATVLTVYGIETNSSDTLSPKALLKLQQYLPFTVLKLEPFDYKDPIPQLLQQYLPFTVLKLEIGNHILRVVLWLQQYLPFTVLKPIS